MKNILDIIKQYPENYLFYSPICGTCTLVNYDDKYIYMSDDGERQYLFTHYGTCILNNELQSKECVLFPSKYNKNWVKPLEDNLQPFDPVIVRDSKNQEWEANFFSRYSSWENKRPFICIDKSYNYCLPYNEITAKLIGRCDSLED